MRHDEIVAWVKRHQSDLPTDLAGLSRFPMRFRTIIVNSVEPERRTRFWAEHLQSFVGPESMLSAEQQEFIVKTIGELPELLKAPAPNPVIIDWEARASRAFTRAEAGRLFAMLGPPEPPEGLPLPADAFPTQSD
jgi:hypothetical protein